MVSRIFRAYIDPGTGSMLFSLLIGVLSTGYFFLRKYIIKLKFLIGGGAKAKESSKRLPYVIFSDHKRYWNVFEPVCDELERRGIDAAYWTCSPDDPALEKPYEHVSCEFIGEGNQAFARLNMMSADVCLSTTPGLDVLQWKRSKDVSWYAHCFHAACTAASYRMFGLTFYDACLVTGENMVAEIRGLERAQKRPPKEIEIVGCTYMDAMAARRAATPRPEHDLPVVLLAPTWGSNGLLARYGSSLIDALISTGYEIVVRPHPQSLTAEKDMMDALMAAYPDGEVIEWNFDNDNFDILNRADVMISDFSGVIFDYSLVFDRPIIYTEATYDDDALDSAWLDEPLWKFTAYTQLGLSLAEKDFPRIKEVIDRALTDEDVKLGIARAKDEAWAHRGHAAEVTVDYLVRKQAEIASARAAAVAGEEE